MRVATIIFGVLCLGMGAAFAVVFAILTVDNLQYPNPKLFRPRVVDTRNIRGGVFARRLFVVASQP